MRKFIFTGIASFVLIVGVASLMFATTASARPATAAVTPKKVTVAMHDPGCHWFVAGPASNRTWSMTKSVKGPVSLLNLDEAALVVVGPTGTTQVTKHVAVGHKVKITKKGAYQITMVGQEPDDNTLKLTIR